jgi:hypothetical protein
MTTRAILSAAVIAVALLACASPQPSQGQSARARPNTINCDGVKQCSVGVSVDRSCGFNSCLKVASDFVMVTSKAKATITWELATADQSDFRFDKDKGIWIDADDGHFTCKSEADGRRFVCTDNQKNADPTVYKYTINVIVVSGIHSPVSPLDPWIINN